MNDHYQFNVYQNNPHMNESIQSFHRKRSTNRDKYGSSNLNSHLIKNHKTKHSGIQTNLNMVF